MDIYDKVCFTISSAGGRRGAQMATFDVGHPDVLDFIRAKREDGRLRQFNLSLLITSEFMEAVKNDAPWPLAFPLSEEEMETHNIDLQDRKKSSGATGRSKITTSKTRKAKSPAAFIAPSMPASCGTSS